MQVVVVVQELVVAVNGSESLYHSENAEQGAAKGFREPSLFVVWSLSWGQRWGMLVGEYDECTWGSNKTVGVGSGSV